MKLLICLLAVAPLLNCASVAKKEPLSEAVRGYHEGVRWGRHNRAAARVDVSLRDRFLDSMSELSDDMRIHHYTVVRSRLSRKGDRAKVHVVIQWFLDSKGTLHKTHLVQEWRMMGPRWLLFAEKHLRGEPLPLTDALMEPKQDDKKVPEVLTKHGNPE